MKPAVLAISFTLFIATGGLQGQDTKSVSTREIVQRVFEKGQEHCELDFYAGTLMLHGMSEFFGRK